MEGVYKPCWARCACLGRPLTSAPSLEEATAVRLRTPAVSTSLNRRPSCSVSSAGAPGLTEGRAWRACLNAGRCRRRRASAAPAMTWRERYEEGGGRKAGAPPQGCPCSAVPTTVQRCLVGRDELDAESVPAQAWQRPPVSIASRVVPLMLLTIDRSCMEKGDAAHTPTDDARR